MESFDRYDVVVVGGGPAGLAAGTFTARNGLSTAILAASGLGGSLPHRPWPERWEQVEKMIEPAKDSGVSMKVGEEVVDFDVKGKQKEVKTAAANYRCSSLVLATGGGSQMLGIQGECWLAHGVCYCAECDASIFAGTRVLVIGQGPSAQDQARRLATEAGEVELILLPQKGQTEVDRRLLGSGRVSVSEVDRVLAIEGELRSKRVIAQKSLSGERVVFEGDGVFIAAGAKPFARILQGAGIRTHTQGCVIVDERSQTNIPGVFAAGACASRGGWNVEICKGQGISAGLSATVFLKLRR